MVADKIKSADESKGVSSKGSISGSFKNAEKWTGRYQRNNKRSGLKNLRCFPYCADSHRLRGFCGREVVVHSKNEEKHTLYSWAEFCKVGGSEDKVNSKVKGSGKGKEVEVGEDVSAEQVAQRARTKTNAFKTWYVGEPAGGDEARGNKVVEFEYNKARKGWNYGWVANKHTCDSLHVLRAYVFKLLPNGSFKCVDIVDSPTFTLFCRRRQRHNLANLPEHLKEQLKTEEAKREAKRKRKLSAAIATTPATTIGSTISKPGNKVPLIAKKRFRAEIEKSTSQAKPSWTGSDLIKTEAPAALPSDAPNAEVKAEAEGSCGGSPRSQLSREKRDDLLWRLIQSLLKLDFDERKSLNEGPTNDASSSTPTVSTNPDPSPNAAATTTATATQTDNGFDDFLEALLPSFGDDLVDFDTMSFGNDVEPLFVDLTDFNSHQLYCKENVLEELARFMIDENNFTQAIEQVLSGTKEKDLTVDEQRRMLLDVFAENIDVFLQRLSMSLEDLDLLLSPSKSSTSLVEKVSKQIPIYSRAKPRKAFSRNCGALPNVSGKWRRTQETLDIMDSIRHQCGLPWIIRKVLVKMERDFELHLTKHTLDYRMPKKLMFNGVIQYKLDGKEHPYINLGSILPMPDVDPENKKKKPFMATYSAYAEGRRIILIKNLDVNKRMWRSVKVTSDGSKLISTISFQEKTESSDWVSRGMWRGIADRVN